MMGHPINRQDSLTDHAPCIDHHDCGCDDCVPCPQGCGYTTVVDGESHCKAYCDTCNACDCPPACADCNGCQGVTA